MKYGPTKLTSFARSGVIVYVSIATSTVWLLSRPSRVSEPPLFTWTLGLPRRYLASSSAMPTSKPWILFVVGSRKLKPGVLCAPAMTSLPFFLIRSMVGVLGRSCRPDRPR